LALPSGQKTTVESIVSYGGELDEAVASQSVLLKLRDEIDLSRGDVLVAPDAPPQLSSQFTAMVVWLHAEPLRLNRTYIAKHLGRHIKIHATRIRFRIDVNTLTEQDAEELEMNGIASVEFEARSPLFFDPYDRNRTMGSFILIDPLSNATLGAGMIREKVSESGARSSSVETLELTRSAVTSEERSLRHGHRAAIFFVGDDLGLGQSLERLLFRRGFDAILVKNELGEESLPVLVSALWSAGMVIVFCGETISARDRQWMESTAGEYFVETLAEAAGTREETVQRVCRIAETLRVAYSAKPYGMEN
jgi:hypothetical protein